MPHVTTHYRVLVVAGRHRQPRNATTWIEPNPQSDAEVVTGTTITPYAPPQLAYVDGGHPQVGNFLFWSATDGTDGQTSTNQTLNQTVGAAPMTITAWYLPPGGGSTPGNGSAFLLDAFSDALGDFVDDTFVTVTSDASLTSDANVVGIIATTDQETVRATGSIHTGETFEQWIGGSPSGDTDTLAAGTSGIAIATYHRQHIQLPPKHVNAQEAVIILYGIVNDASGAILVNGHPVPVDPGWGSFLGRVNRAAGMTAMGSGTRGAAEVAKLALDEVLDAAKQLQAQVGKQIQK